MKRILLFSLIFTCLAGTAYYLINKESTTKMGSYDFADRNFGVEEENDIRSFKVSEPGAKPVLFERKDDHWIVDGLHRADENVMFNLLQALTQIQMDFIPNKNAKNGILEEMDRFGIQIEVFGKRNKLLRSYRIGSNTQGETGTHYLMDGSKQPYAMVIPGMNGAVRNRFQFTMERVRDKIIFRDLGKKIDTIKLDFPKDKLRSFVMTREGNDYDVKPMYKNTKIIDRPVNTKLAETYFNEFDKIASEWIENGNAKKDSIESIKPFAQLSLSLKNGEQQSLALIPLNDVIDPNVITTDLESLQKVERYFGSSSWGDLYLIQHRLIKDILRPYEYFFAYNE